MSAMRLETERNQSVPLKGAPDMMLALIMNLTRISTAEVAKLKIKRV